MAKLHVYAAGVTAGFVILLTGAAAGEAEVLKQARPIFYSALSITGSLERP
jgi:hypothetical protein